MAEDGENGASGADDAVEKLNAKNRELLGELKALKAKVKQFDGLDPDAIHEALSFKAEAEQRKAEERGEFEKALKAKEVEFQRKLEKASSRERKLESILDRQTRERALAEAIRAKGGDPEYVMHKGLDRVKVKETDDSFDIVVLDEKGTELGGVEALDVLASELREKYPRAFDGTGSSGSSASPAQRGGGPVNWTDPVEAGKAADRWIRENMKR